MNLARLRSALPDWKNILAALASAVLLILAFPDFEYWILAWFALVPLLWAVEREKASTFRSFVLGWIFGTAFFFGTCWWLTFAPITYAGFPWPLAYFLLLMVTTAAGIFPAVFAAILAVLLKRLGTRAFLAAPFVWVFTEFLRFWVTGNNWNAIGYSQAFHMSDGIVQATNVGGIYLAGFSVLVWNSFLAAALSNFERSRVLRISPVCNDDTESSSLPLSDHITIYALIGYLNPFVGAILFIVDSKLGSVSANKSQWRKVRVGLMAPILCSIGFSSFVFFASTDPRFFDNGFARSDQTAFLVAIQPNVPMNELDTRTLERLQVRHVELAGKAYASNFDKIVAEKLDRDGKESDRDIYRQIVQEKFATLPKLVVFPESPMNFAYEDDSNTQEFINEFARRNNVSVLFNSAEPDKTNGKYFNSAVMVSPEGREVAEYDKIYLLPFGEAVPVPLEGLLPGFVGNFSYGKKYDLLPVGDAKAGVMICFESHFGQLSRRYVQDGADVIIEMTNDGYLGPTPVLRQHLANAVFRAVETNRPVLRVTNVGITAYINEKGEVLDAAQPYQEDTRVWSVSKSDGSQTLYVKYGDWFAWLCSIMTIGLLFLGFRRSYRFGIGVEGKP